MPCPSRAVAKLPLLGHHAGSYLLRLLIFLGLFSATPAAPRAHAASSTVTIAQAYAAGGEAGASWQHDYVVLFNKSAAPINLSGWTLQMKPLLSPAWQAVPLCGTVGAGHYYLVQLASGGPLGAPLPPADCAAALGMDKNNFTIVLLSDSAPLAGSCPSTATLVDRLGWGPDPVCAEGTAETPPVDPAFALWRSIACADTDDNAFDFVSNPANPRNSSDTDACSNQPPVIQPIPDAVMPELAALEFVVPAFDPEGSSVTFTASGPTWATIHPTTGQCTLTPDLLAADTDGGIYSVTVTASDGALSSSDDFAVTVLPFTTSANTPSAGGWPGGINMATRELTRVEAPDLCLAGGPLTLCFGRYYASFITRESGGLAGPMGPNWSMSFSDRCEFEFGVCTVIDGRHGRIVFEDTPGVGWVQKSHLEERCVLQTTASSHRLYRSGERLIYEFDLATGRLQAILDERGNALTCSYAAALLSEVSDGLGRVLSFGYDAPGRLTTVSDGTRSVGYAYDAAGRLATFTDAAGGVTSYAYDPGPIPGLLTGATLPAGNTPRTYVHDSDGRVASTSDALGGVWSFTQTFPDGPVVGGILVVTMMPTGGTWQASTDARHRLRSLRNPRLGITSWEHQFDGRIASVTRPLGDVTTFTYDPASGYLSDLGFPDGTHETYQYVVRSLQGFDVFLLSGLNSPDGTSVQFSHDAQGILGGWTDRAGLPWSRTHNARGQVLTETNPSGGITTYEYDALARRISRTDHAGNTTTFGYDGLHRLTTVTHPDLTTRSLSYDGNSYLVAWIDEAGEVWNQPVDANGRRTSFTDPLGHTRTYAYDAMNRLASATDAMEGVRIYEYDALGRLASYTDATSRTTGFDYDPVTAQVQVIQGAFSTSYQYDANDRLDGVGGPLGWSWGLQRNSMGRLTQTTDPTGAATQYAYDSMGRLVTSTPTVGDPITYGHDPRGPLDHVSGGALNIELARNALGRIAAVEDPNNNVWPYAYDAMGRLVSRTDPLGRTTSYEYDARGRVSRITTPVGTEDLTYDAAGRCTARSISGGSSLSYAYDAAGRLTAATGATFTYDAADRLAGSNGIDVTRDAEGRITSETYAAGKVVTYGYDARGLLTTVQDWLGGTTTFTRDAAGRVVGIARPNGTSATLAYDAADRLIEKVEANPGPVQSPFASFTLTRDAMGRVASRVRASPIQAVMPPGIAGTNFDAASQVVGWDYDGLGRLVKSGTPIYEWDDFSRLRHYAAGADSPFFSYDAFGRILTRTQGAAMEQFVWNYGNASPTLDLWYHGAHQHYFVHTPSGMLLYRIDDPGSTRHFYHYDDQGNTVCITGPAGEIETMYDYTPTGTAVAVGQAGENPFSYRASYGAITLESTGRLYLAPARSGAVYVYDARISRCISCPAAPLASMMFESGWSTCGAGSLSRLGPGWSDLRIPVHTPEASTSQWAYIGLEACEVGMGRREFDLEPRNPEKGRHTPFFNKYRPQFYFRTTDVTGEVVLPEGREMVMPGDDVQTNPGPIQSPLAVAEGGPNPLDIPIWLEVNPGPVQSPFTLHAINPGPPASPFALHVIDPMPPQSDSFPLNLSDPRTKAPLKVFDVVPGVVTGNSEPAPAPYRIKFKLPWLPAETDCSWIRSVTSLRTGAGRVFQGMFTAIPEVDDEVLVGFVR